MMTAPCDERRKPTLLVLSSTYPRWADDHEPGFVHELAKRLTDQFRVIALAPHAAGAARREVMDGVDVVRFRYAPPFAERLSYEGGIASNLRSAAWKCLLVPGFALSQLVAAWQLVRHERVDLVHAHWALPQGVTARLVRMLTGTPYVATCHGSDLHGLRGRFWAIFKRFATVGAARVTTVSDAMRRLLPQEVERTAVVIPMGVDMDSAFVPGSSALPESPALLFVGRLVPGKGADVLLRAFATARASDAGMTLTLVGDGPEAASLRALAHALGIDDVVTFEGAVEPHRLPAFYRQASLLVVPYRGQEGLGLVMIEALACGCPVITTRVDAVRDIFNGHWPEPVAEPGSVASLTEVLVSATGSLALLRAQADAMRPALAARFGWDGSASAYAELLAGVLDQR